MDFLLSENIRCRKRGEKKSAFTSRLLAVLCGVIFLAAAGCGGSGPAQPSADSLPGIEEMLSDKVLGDPNAPITIIDYSSLTCPHCADFHLNTLPQIKEKYIATGKAKLVCRDFPFNQTGLDASMLARCTGSAGYFEALELIYRNQASWAGDADPGKALANILGMSEAKAEACLADKALGDGIQAIAQEGQQSYGVTSTPTFIINGQKVVGSQPFAVFDQVLGALAP